MNCMNCMNFFVSITTIRTYQPALDMMIQSLPDEWKNKYIVVYQNENENHYKVFLDGHIEVYLKNNLSDYGNFVGINMLFDLNIIPQNSWILFVHDTCKFMGNDCVVLTDALIAKHDNSDVDIVWLCNTGQCNICLIRKKAISIGNACYKDIQHMTKMETIEYEWNHKHTLSPKSFDVKHHFINTPTQHLGQRFVYNKTNKRDCLLYKSIHMEKYYFHTRVESDHPFAP